MKRNIDKFRQLGSAIIDQHKPDDLSLSETTELFRRAQSTLDANSIIDVIQTAYYMGYAVGYRRGSGRDVRLTTVGAYLKDKQRAGSADK